MIGISYIYFILISLIIWGIYRIIVYIKIHNINILREVFINLFFIYFLTVIYLTFFKGGILNLNFQRKAYINIIPLTETIKMFKDNFMGLSNSIYNVCGNILLFVPLGFGIPLLFKNYNKVSKVILYGFLSSLSIETLQYFTSTNLTDIDDIIFNTLGAVVGFILFNIFISLIEKTKLIYLVDKLRSNYNGSLLFLSLKYLFPITASTIVMFFGIIYSFTVSGKLPDEELAADVFNNSSFNYSEYVSFFNHKLFLTDYGDYIGLSMADEVLNNRWISGGSTQASWNGQDYGYHISIINDDEGTGIIVFGKNNDAKTVTINYAGDIYTELLSPDSYFITAFPTLKVLDEDTTIYDIYSTGKSADLKITFNDDDGSLCSHIKYLR